MIFTPCIGTVVSSCIPYKFGFLAMSADNVLGQVGPAVKVCFGVRQLYQLSVPLTRDQLDRMGSLGPCPSAVVVQASQLPGFSG